MQYKVITTNSGLFSSGFSPKKLEEALNRLADDGWQVVGVTAGQFPPLKHDQAIVVLAHP